MSNAITRYGCLAAALALLPATTGAEDIREFEDKPFFTTFETFTQDEWYIADFAIKRESFHTAWGFDQVHVTDDSKLELSIDPAPIGTGKRFLGAEVQLRDYSHYGRYEVVMKGAAGHGVISAFFTYTGPYFEDPHDEIDFEFLGRDTTKVWVTRFADGERLPGEWIDLGFDYSEQEALYAFDWLEDRIVWYVNGEEIFRVEAKDRTLPTNPGRIYLSIWGGGEAQENWSGIAPRNTRAVVSYDCVSYVPVGQTGQQCSDLPEWQ